MFNGPKKKRESKRKRKMYTVCSTEKDIFTIIDHK